MLRSDRRNIYFPYEIRRIRGFNRSSITRRGQFTALTRGKSGCFLRGKLNTSNNFLRRTRSLGGMLAYKNPTIFQSIIIIIVGTIFIGLYPFIQQLLGTKSPLRIQKKHSFYQIEDCFPIYGFYYLQSFRNFIEIDFVFQCIIQSI